MKGERKISCVPFYEPTVENIDRVERVTSQMLCILEQVTDPRNRE